MDISHILYHLKVSYIFKKTTTTTTKNNFLLDMSLCPYGNVFILSLRIYLFSLKKDVDVLLLSQDMRL